MTPGTGREEAWTGAELSPAPASLKPPSRNGGGGGGGGQMERELCRPFCWPPGAEQSRVPFLGPVPRKVPTSPVVSAPAMESSGFCLDPGVTSGS